MTTADDLTADERARLTAELDNTDAAIQQADAEAGEVGVELLLAVGGTVVALGRFVLARRRRAALRQRRDDLLGPLAEATTLAEQHAAEQPAGDTP